jgi:MFS family permease
MGAGRIAGQMLIGRLNERGLIVTGSVVAAAGLMVVALAPMPGVVHAGLIVMGVGASVIAPTGFAVIGRMTPESARTLVLARATALGYLGYFFGPPVLGLLSQLLTLRWAFLATAVLVLAVPFLLAALTRSAGQGHGEAEGSR